MAAEQYDWTGEFILAVCPNPSVDIFAWIGKIHSKKVNRITREEHYPGGKGVHVALAAAELGEMVQLLAFWGGPTGNWIKQECERLYPSITCIGPTTKEWSRSCFTFKADGEFDETELLGVGPSIDADEMDAFLDAFEISIDRAKCVTMSGSWPEGGSGNEYSRLVSLANQFQKATFLDCTGAQLHAALTAGPYAIHLNRNELISQFEGEDLWETLRSLADQCTWVAITQGAKGLFLCDRAKSIHALCKIEEVISAVGSGDCLLAGLAVAYSRGLDPFEASKLAASCGAANCLRPELGMMDRQDVDRLFKQAQMQVFDDHSVIV